MIMRRILLFLMAGFLWACNNESGANTNDASDASDRPRDINEGVTNSTKIVNDSVIIPDTNNTGTDPSRTDTSGSKMD